ncbi:MULTISPECIES: hypothetical protein [unclassified Rathayibacter]|uniref:hypothetical protein n=1 Tax=unclassified Rathayibacter TaxID=2609250 RepID=UPI000CE74F44|nr:MULTISPECIES: hypothetical protein [unclassified Rathayibacter]PPF18320.1 hypothetical protein C5B95_11995 [Rathayibacter sp. AY1A7]PPF34386.1 hypothetical protein C5C10_09295 [Rathayibacter sp. AY1A3]
MTAEDPNFYLRPLLKPLLEWMAANNATSLLIRASPSTCTALLTRPPSEPDAHFLCDEPPDAPGQLGIFTVVDGASGGRHDGPCDIPMKILGPLLNELDTHDIEEIRIATGPGASPTPDSSGSTANTHPTYSIDEFDEDITPTAEVMPFIISFQLRTDDDR